MLCRDGHSLWLASSSGHQADTLGWADIYSALCQLSDSGWQERWKKGKALHGSSSWLQMSCHHHVLYFPVCALFRMQCFADDCVGGFWCVFLYLACFTVSTFLLHGKIDNLATAEIDWNQSWKGDFHTSVPNENKTSDCAAEWTHLAAMWICFLILVLHVSMLKVAI